MLFPTPVMPMTAITISPGLRSYRHSCQHDRELGDFQNLTHWMSGSEMGGGLPWGPSEDLLLVCDPLVSLAL